MDHPQFPILMATGRSLVSRRRAWPESDSLRVKRATALIVCCQGWRQRLVTSLPKHEEAALQRFLAEAQRFLDDHDESRRTAPAAVAFPRVAWS